MKSANCQRPAPPPGGSRAGRAKRLRDIGTWVIAALFVAQFLVAFRPDALAWDGVFYYANTRSIALDGDLWLANDIALSYETTPSKDFAAQRFDLEKTATGRVASPFAIGTSLLWLPWYLATRAAVSMAGFIGLGLPLVSGYEWPFTWVIASVTSVFGLCAVLVSYRFAKRLVSRWAALAASATAMFATPLLFYQFREPFYGHTASAMVTALFVSLWWRHAEDGESEDTSAFLLGALGGLGALVRTQNLAYLVLPLATEASLCWRALRERDRKSAWRPVRRAAVTTAGGLVVLTIQLAVWRAIYGEWATIPQGPTFIDWAAPWLKPVLLSSLNGLLPWMPLVIPALAGLVIIARRNPRLGLPLLASLALQAYINGCVSQWFGGGGYGPRRFSSTLIILPVGFAALLDWRRDRWYRAGGVVLGLLLIVHQWLIVSYGFDAQIGGVIISDSAPFAWRVDGVGVFLVRLARLVPPALRDPVRTLVLGGAPLASARGRPAVLGVQLLLLGAVVGVAYVIQLAICRGASTERLARLPRWLGPTVVTTIVLLTNVWLLTRA